MADRTLTLGFDDFELDALRFELRRSGEPVTVQPKVLRVLLHLAANRERSVSSRELLEVLWPGEAVTAASVKRAIAGARRALGERGGSESIIRTVRGHGYRFMRDVRTLGPAAARGPASGRSTPQPIAAEVSHTVDGAFFGREQTLATLDRALTEVSTGRGRQLLIRGEPGMGKSSTLRELGRRARDRGALVLWARCTVLYPAPPLWPVLQMLREAADAFEPALLGALMGNRAAPIPDLHPELKRLAPESAELSAAERFQFLHALVSLLQHTAARRPVVLLFDDLHHADAATLQLIAALAQQLDHSRVLVAAAMRPVFEADRGREPLRSVAAALCNHRIELEPIADCELATHFSQRLGESLPAVAIAALRDWAGGNPRLCDHVLQYAIAAAAEGGEWWCALDRCGQSAGSDAILERQLAALTQPCRDLLPAAAVLGRNFSLATLARTVDRRVEDVLARISDAIALGLIGKSPGAISDYRFTHALVREMLYAHMPRAERANWHARVGVALETQRASDDPALLGQLAEHFTRAAPGDDDERAIRYTMQAARAAMQRAAYDEAVNYIDRALQLTELGCRCERERQALLLDKSEALASLGDAARSRDAASKAAVLARERQDVDGMVRAANLLGRLPMSDCLDAGQMASIDHALAALSQDDARRPALEALLAREQIWSRNPVARAQRASSALAAARSVGDPAARAEALVGCLHALADPEFLPQRLTICEELECIGRELSDRQLLVSSAAGRVWACAELGDMPGVDANISALEILAEHGHEPRARWHAKVFGAMRAIVAGRLETAASDSREALELGTKFGRANAYHVYCTQMGGILRLEGRLEEAAALVRDVSLRHPAIAGWQAALASIEVELGRVEHGREVLQRLLDRDLAALYGDPYGLGALAPAADLCAQVGDAAQAKRVYDALLPYADRHGVISMGTNTHGPLARHLGRLAMRMNDSARAERHLKRAIESAERCESPTFTSLGCLAYAQLLISLGRAGARERAATLTTRAFQIASDAGLRIVADRAKALAQHAKLGLRMPQSSARERAGAS